MKRIGGSVVSMMLLAGIAAMGGPAAAQEGWLLRVRAARLVAADDSTAITALGVPKNAINVSDKTIPDLSIAYFLTPNIGVELLLTIPQKHHVSIDGVGRIGSFKHLPPALLAQYHFMPASQISPYVGAGVNYTRIFDANLAVPGVGGLKLEKSSVGPAVQAGVDYRLDRNWLVNFDVKWMQIRSDVKLQANSAKISKVKVDPFLFGVGLGYHF